MTDLNLKMELGVHQLINLVTKDLTSLLDFWKDRRYETDSTESFRHFIDYEEDIKSFLSKVDVQLEFWKRLKSLDDGDEDSSSKKNNKSSTSTIDSGCQTEATTLVRNSKIGHTEDKAESSNSQQQNMSENIGSICDSNKDVENPTHTTFEKEITNPEMETEMTEMTATSTSDSGLELHDKNVICCISNTETVRSDSPVVADTPSSTIDLSEDVIIDTKKEPEEVLNCQTGMLQGCI